MFFFFKQKTAYEMRISDWSSDVCSSDPHCTNLGGRFCGPWAGFDRRQYSLAGCHAQARHRAICQRRLAHDQASKLASYIACHAARKSVVEGKSVSVRVDIGGRCIITKKDV